MTDQPSDTPKRRFTERKPVAWLIKTSKRIVLPGFGGMPLFDVLKFFIKGLVNGYITSRASAISFSFFLAIFPFLIFLFTIIPFVPIANFQQTLLDVLEDFMPAMAWDSVKETIIDIITRPRSGLLILNFFLALYFSTNGINSLIEAFNNTAHTMETRTLLKQYLISVLLLFILSSLLIVSIALMTIGPKFILFLLPDAWEKSWLALTSIELIRWVIVLGLLLMAISMLYYFAPAKRSRYRLISAGSLISTLLIILTTLGFNYYVDNFSKYNALYGSIGTLLVVLVWIYMNAISLLIGFELNMSIVNAREEKEEASFPQAM
jgi:membrane protein